MAEIKLRRKLIYAGDAYTAILRADPRLAYCIERIKAVDAVEVVHGRWIDEYPYVRCSECNAEWINCRTDNEPKLFYYCPNCGADMRERKDNEID